MSHQAKTQTTDEPTSKSTPPNQESTTTKEGERNYRCPHCGAQYENEMIARVHISRSEDDQHANHNGFMPEEAIELVDGDGNVVQHIRRRRAEMDPESLSIEDFPHDISEANRHVLLSAAHHPDEETKSEIARYTQQRLENSDIDPPAYRTACGVLKEFYRPQELTRDNDEELSDLTPKQQAVLIARLSDPDASYGTLADRVGVAESYPRQVLDRAPHVLDKLRQEQDQTRDIEAIVRDELTDSDIETLQEKELLERVSVDVDVETADEESDDSWGSPVEEPNKLRAVPEMPHQDTSATSEENTKDTGGTENKENTEQTELSESTGDDTETQTEASETDDTPRQQIPRKEVAQLRSHVSFLRKVMNREELPSASDGMLAVAIEVEKHCEQILQANSQ